MAERNEAQHLVYSDHYANAAADDEDDLMRQKIIDRYGGDSSQEDDTASDSGFTGIAQYVMDSSDDMKSKTKKLVIPVFVAIGIAAGVMIVTGLVGGFIGGIISMLAIVAMTWVGAFLGMFGTYLWGTLEDGIARLKDQNNEYEGEIGTLTDTRDQLSDMTKSFFISVGELQWVNSDEFEEHLDEFNELREALQQIHGNNKQLQDLLNDFAIIAKEQDQLMSVMKENERAQILAIFYEVGIHDGYPGLNEEEYDIFLDRIDPRLRALFREAGTFKENSYGDGVIDLEEFEPVLHNVVDKLQSEHEL
eukprot:331855_1